MSTLFETDKQSAGWHLSYLEIFNWGTFHDRIYRLAPQGLNSLLTGANGSGKTTVVDALVTLMVPPGKRHYNQSSGTDKKKERDETSYILGAYGTIRDEDSTSGTTQYLRGKDDYSIILASFKNQSFQQDATLVQIRWFSAGVLKRSYILSSSVLEIEKDLVPFETTPGWRKKLTAKHPVKFFETFTLYSQAFSSLFGLKSDKALSLFSHVVGVKVLGDLNAFIRENMLEGANMEEEFEKLKKNYEDLLGSHKQIEKAREQLNILEPAVTSGQKWQHQKIQKEKIDEAFEAVAPVFAFQEGKLLGEARTREESRLIAVEAKKADLDIEIETARRKERDLEFALRDPSKSGLVEGIERDLSHHQILWESKFKKYKDYLQMVQNLELPPPADEKDFWSFREDLTRQKRQFESSAPSQETLWADERQNLKNLEDQEGSYVKELTELTQKEGCVPAYLTDLRDQLAKAIDTSAQKLPFFASLVSVKKEQWKGVIELLLKPLSFSIVVDQSLAEKARSWVNENSLNQTLTFLILSQQSNDQFFVDQQSDLVVDALEFRKNEPQAEALKGYLRKNWDFRLCETLDELETADRGIIPQGWVRNGKHWVRPAQGWDDPGTFILGWENDVKRQHISSKLKKLRVQEEDKRQSLVEVEKKRKLAQEKLILLEKLLAYQSWSEIDHIKEKTELDELQLKQKQLKSDTGKDEVLQKELETLQREIKVLNKEKDEVGAHIGRLKKTLEEYIEEETQTKRILMDFADFDLEKGRQILDPWLKQVNILLDLGSLVKIKDEVLKTLSLQKKKATEDLKLCEKELETLLHRYINPGADLAAKYPEWTGETSNLMAKADYLDEFEELYNRIRREDLPGYQKRFKDWLNQRLVEDIADFRTSLENHQKAILDTIRELNAALESITYSTYPSTFIRLNAEESKDVQIRDFRRMLKEALEMETDADMEKVFHRIRGIIQALSDNEDWRKKVTDVRNWLQFSALELFRETGKQKQYYQDSQSLSGGEKAKLAYTILASAIAFQFGIRSGNAASHSFRFAVVDEAFSKVDPENSKFAMNLFAQLNLQLMVVTPLDKINVVEDYIHTIHYVENKQRKISAVYDLSIQQYRNAQETLEESLQ